MTEKELFAKIVPEAKRRKLIHKRVIVGPKSTFFYHKWINWLLNLVYPESEKDSYLNRFWTTIGYDIAGPDKASYDGLNFHQYYTLIHELKHTQQRQRWTFPLFAFLYLWPLSQGALLLLTCWVPLLFGSNWITLLCMAVWLIFAAIHFIPQLPDPFRAHWELEAYTLSMYFYCVRFGKIDRDYIEYLIKNFNSMSYFIMEPRKDRIRKKLNNISVAISMGKHPVCSDPLVKLVEDLQSGRAVSP